MYGQPPPAPGCYARMLIRGRRWMAVDTLAMSRRAAYLAFPDVDTHPPCDLTSPRPRPRLAIAAAIPTNDFHVHVHVHPASNSFRPRARLTCAPISGFAPRQYQSAGRCGHTSGLAPGRDANPARSAGPRARTLLGPWAALGISRAPPPAPKAISIPGASW